MANTIASSEPTLCKDENSGEDQSLVPSAATISQMRTEHVNLLGRTAIDFDLGVFVEGAFGAAFGVKADELGFLAFGVDQLALVGFEEFAICTCTEFGAVVLIVVENDPRIFGKLSVIGDLNNHVVINFGGVVGVP